MSDYRSYTRWDVIKDEEHLESSDLFFDGHGYIGLRDGSRLDVEANGVFYNRKGSLDLD
jgi:hypothetical protein